VKRKKSVLVVGGCGFVGAHIALALRTAYKVFATYRKNRVALQGVTCLPMDLTNRDWVKRVIYTSQPDVIVFAAGEPDIDKSEDNTRETEQVHAGGPASILTAADIFQPKFILVSNGYVFDGKKGNFRESDAVLPNSALGKSTLGGENFLKGNSMNYAILRCSPLLGQGHPKHPSFLDRLAWHLDRGERVELPTTEFHSFGTVAGLVSAVALLVERGAQKRLYHYGGLTRITYHELGSAYAARFGYDSKLVLPYRPPFATISHDTPLFDYSLNSSAIAGELKLEPATLEQALDLLEKEPALGP